MKITFNKLSNKILGLSTCLMSWLDLFYITWRSTSSSSTDLRTSWKEVNTKSEKAPILQVLTIKESGVSYCSRHKQSNQLNLSSLSRIKRRP